MLKKIKQIIFISACTVGGILFLMFLSFHNIDPTDLETFVGAKIGQTIGVTMNSAAVKENPINKLALELSKKEKELDRYEYILEEKERQIESNSSLIDNRILLIFSFVLSALFVLVLTNFYLDSRHRREEKQGGKRSP
ncbi:hypothetical protein GF382_00805 [Candidatus Falkowbacteria bacterium]|nr:hypothetical protein [Candidatus Falkowbacteria bacterium]